MTFKRPYNVTTTQMAQWVDSNASCASCDIDKLVEYLYHIVYAKAEKASFFIDYDKYDDFSLFCIPKLLTRLKNKEEPHVKSIVNYIKSVIEYWRAEYVRDFCCGSAEFDIADFNVGDFGDYLIDESCKYDYISYDLCCLKISDVVWKHLRKIPRKLNSAEWSNIYTSCLLTLQERLIYASKYQMKEEVPDKPRFMRDLKLRPPVLFHLSEEYSNYINVLVNEIIHAIANEISSQMHERVSVSSCLRNLVTAASNEEEDT